MFSWFLTSLKSASASPKALCKRLHMHNSLSLKLCRGQGLGVEPGTKGSAAGIQILKLQVASWFYTGAKPALFPVACKNQSWTIPNKPSNSGLLILGFL